MPSSMYERPNETARTRPNISAPPTRFDSAQPPRLAPNEVVRIFDGARILIATAVPEALERLRLSLRELGAQIFVHNALEDALELASALDPQVVLLDRESLKGRSTTFFRKLHSDPRLRWASVVRINASELTQIQVGTLEKLANALKPKLIADAKLSKLASEERPFLLRLSRLGGNRILRSLEDVPGSIRVTVTAQRSLCRLDVQGGSVLGAHFKIVASPKTLDGLQALAAFLAQEEGEVRIEQRDRLTLNNIGLPIAEALDRGAKRIDELAGLVEHSALLEAKALLEAQALAHPIANTAKYQRTEAGIEELADDSIEFVTYDNEHTRRVQNPTAVLGPNKSDVPKARSTPLPPIPTPIPAKPSAQAIRVTESITQVKKLPDEATAAGPERDIAKPVGTVSGIRELAPSIARRPDLATADEAKSARPDLPRLGVQIDVPRRTKRRPAASSTMKVRIEGDSAPKPGLRTLRFLAFAAGCVALGFVMTTAIRTLLVSDDSSSKVHTASGIHPTSMTLSRLDSRALPTPDDQPSESANAAAGATALVQALPTLEAAGSPGEDQPTAPPKKQIKRERLDQTVRIPTRPSQADTIIPDREDDKSETAETADSTAQRTPVQETDSPSAAYRRADRLIASGNTDQAIIEMSSMLAANARDHRAMASIASASLKSGQTEEAVRWARRAVEVAPSVPSYHNLLGDSLGLLGERDEAVKHWNEAKRLQLTSN